MNKPLAKKTLSETLAEKLRQKTSLLELAQRSTATQRLGDFWHDIYNQETGGESSDEETKGIPIPKEPDRDWWTSPEVYKASQYASLDTYLSDTAPRPNRPEFWGGDFVPSSFHSTGSTIGDILQGFRTSMLEKGTLKDLAPVLASLRTPAAPFVSVFSILGATPSSSLNPANDPIIRNGLFELYSKSPVSKSLFSTPKEFQAFLDNMFGVGSTLEMREPIKAISKIWEKVLGYTPTLDDYFKARTFATDTIRGLAMAMNPATYPSFQLYKQLSFDMNRMGYGVENPSFHDFAHLYDLSTQLGVRPEEILPAWRLGYADAISPITLTSDEGRAELRDKLRSVSNDIYSRVDLDQAIRDYKAGKISWQDWARRTLDIIQTRREANTTGRSYIDLKHVKEQAEKQKKEAEREGLKDWAEDWEPEKQTESETEYGGENIY